MDIGFAQAGFNIIFANDIDPFAITTHKKTHLSQDTDWAEAAKNLANCKKLLLWKMLQHLPEIGVGLKSLRTSKNMLQPTIRLNW